MKTTFRAFFIVAKELAELAKSSMPKNQKRRKDKTRVVVRRRLLSEDYLQ